MKALRTRNNPTRNKQVIKETRNYYKAIYEVKTILKNKQAINEATTQVNVKKAIKSNK